MDPTLEREWAYARSSIGKQERLELLASWLHAYDVDRPHTALGGRCPMDLVSNVSKNHA